MYSHIIVINLHHNHPNEILFLKYTPNLPLNNVIVERPIRFVESVSAVTAVILGTLYMAHDPNHLIQIECTPNDVAFRGNILKFVYES